jgi:hypothetical protein
MRGKEPFSASAADDRGDSGGAAEASVYRKLKLGRSGGEVRQECRLI